MKAKALLIGLFLQLTVLTGAEAQVVHLSIAASMTDAFKAVIDGFSATHTSAQIRPNFASSGSLAKQIEQGAPADIFVSANPGWTKYLLERHLLEANTNYMFAFNTLVFIGRQNPTVRRLDDLVNLERIAIGSPQSVPAGQYARQAMEQTGIYNELRQANKLVMAKDVRQALIYADRGEVDGAFVYKTDALLARSAEILFTVPKNLYNRVSYTVALTSAGAQNKGAKAFLNYMSSPEVDAILSRFGFKTNRHSFGTK